VNRLRNRLILVFLAATLAPLLATVWITSVGSQYLLDFSTTDQLESISKSLEQTGREFYQRAREDLKRRAASGEIAPQKFEASQQAQWPDSVKAFAESGEAERFGPVGNQGDTLEYMLLTPLAGAHAVSSSSGETEIQQSRDRQGAIWVYTEHLGPVAMDRLRQQIADSRTLVEKARERDFRRGFRLTYLLLATSFWLVSLALLVYMAHRISRPIHQLTGGLTELAAGDLNARVPPRGNDEIGRAIQAFNHMAGKLQESTERLVYLRQLASWQTLARKMAHEVKNSLTPIRLTVEEMLARHDERDRPFMEQATQIVVDEIETLERRIRAFSQFAAEPPVRPAPVDVNSLVEERVAFLQTAHPEVAYDCRLADDSPQVQTDPDLLKGILTNLLENAAEAAGAGGRILGVTTKEEERVAIEVHDSGPGLNEQTRANLFQPTISFKKRGMGLGLSIARKSAMLCGGDIVVVKGELGGAGFRVLLPISTNGIQTSSDRG
jgi:nitrogen fixation/metabolism regulation signal transduction histidine kinase